MLIIDELILELTRKCNMKCPHCLRGEAQNVDMADGIITRAFEDVKSVGMLLFAGGEPFLNTHAMEYALQAAKQNAVPVSGVFVVTNGKEYDARQISVMEQWHAYCFPGRQAEDAPECFGVAVSKDEYHEPIPEANYRKYASLPFYRKDKECTPEKPIGLISEGRGGAIAGSVPLELSGLIADVDGEDIRVKRVYISANGNVSWECDLSYEHADMRSPANICDYSLQDIVEIQAA